MSVMSVFVCMFNFRMLWKDKPGELVDVISTSISAVHEEVEAHRRWVDNMYHVILIFNALNHLFSSVLFCIKVDIHLKYL